MTDISKVFDCISHNQLLVKLNAYGLDQNSLNVIYNYLFGRSQKTKVDSSFSHLLDILHGVPQGSILGPLLFNRSVCGLFPSKYSSEFPNFVDDTTPYECDKKYDELIINLKTQ